MPFCARNAQSPREKLRILSRSFRFWACIIIYIRRAAHTNTVMNNIIIVGGSSGIGLALCQKLKDRNVINISRTPCAVAGITDIRADVCDIKSLEKAFKQIHKADALVYCAGTSMAAPVEYVKHSDVRCLFDTNVLGAVMCCKLALPLLKSSRDGRIVFVSSSASVTPVAFDSFYSASKAALNMFSQAVGLETGVKCTSAIVGGTQTRFSFKRAVYDDCGEYDVRLKTAADRLIKLEQNGYSADFVAQKLVKILSAENPPPEVTIGAKNKLMLAAYRLLPKRVALHLAKSVQIGD